MRAYFIGLMVALFSFASSAFAVALDVSDVTTALTDAATPVNLVGLGMLGALVGIVVLKLIRKAL